MPLFGLTGILIGLGLLIWLAYRGWSVLLLAPLAAMVTALFAREPLLAHWTQTFMSSAAGFLAQFFPLFLLGALFGKLMEDSGSVTAIARFVTERLGTHRTMLAVVLAGAIVTYGGVSLFVAFFVLVPMAQQLFRSAGIPRRLMPGAIVLGTSTFTMSAFPGTPSIQNAIPMPFFGTTPFAAPGLGILASLIMFGFGMWWLGREEARSRINDEGWGGTEPSSGERLAVDETLRERATTAREFDPAEIARTKANETPLAFLPAALPLVIVVSVNLAMSIFFDTAAGYVFPQRSPLGRDLSCCCWRGLGRDDSSSLRDCGSARIQFSPLADGPRDDGRGRQRVGAPGPQRGEPGGIRRRCRGGARL